MRPFADCTHRSARDPPRDNGPAIHLTIAARGVAHDTSRLYNGVAVAPERPLGPWSQSRPLRKGGRPFDAIELELAPLWVTQLEE